MAKEMSGYRESSEISHFTRQDREYYDKLTQLVKLEQELTNKNIRLSEDRKTQLRNEINELKKRLSLETATAKEIEKLKDNAAAKRNKENKKIAENTISIVTTAFARQRQQLESYMSSLNSMRESIAYGISGTNTSLASIVNNINAAVGVSNVVKQESLYKNLQSLIDSGIVYNAEQRAYLTTLAEDLGMAFRADNASLSRLVNLYREDVSSQRMAIEASLKTFLNQNYQTSQYIKQGFENVSNALFEAQALMSTSEAMSFEATIQKWMGSLSSIGMSNETITSLASAINAASSGNVSALSGGISNLLYMGAARSNVDIGDMLSRGLSGASAEALMRGIVDYIASMGASESNVVKSALARSFGINVSDIIAASKLRDATLTEALSTNINDALLNSVWGNYVSVGTMFDYAQANKLFSQATAMTLPAGGSIYALYKTITDAADLVASMTKGITLEAAPLGVGVSKDLGETIQLATDIAALGSSKTLSGISKLAGTIESLIGGGVSFGGGLAGLTYSMLGSSGLGSRSMRESFSSAGSLSSFLQVGETGQSGSAIIGESTDVAAEKVISSAKKETKREVDADRATSNERNINDLYDAVLTIKDSIGKNGDKIRSSVIAHTNTVSPQLNSLSYLSNIDTNVLAILNIMKSLDTQKDSGLIKDMSIRNSYNTIITPEDAL